MRKQTGECESKMRPIVRRRSVRFVVRLLLLRRLQPGEPLVDLRGGGGDTHVVNSHFTLPQTIPCFESACGSVASLWYLEQSFSFSREFLGDVFFPCEEGFFFDDLHVVEVDKVAQQHALWKDKHLDVQVVMSFTSGSCFWTLRPSLWDSAPSNGKQGYYKHCFPTSRSISYHFLYQL